MVASSDTYPLNLSRKQLQDYFGNNPDLIRAMEKVFNVTTQIINSGIVGPGGGGGGSGGGGGVNLTDESPDTATLAFELVSGLQAIMQSVLMQPQNEIIIPPVDQPIYSPQVIIPDINTPLDTSDFVRWGELYNILQSLGYNPPLALSTMAEQSKTNVQIQGGAIDNTPIGSSTPSTGVFTGVTNGGNAGAGIVGEYQAQASTGTALTTGVAANAVGTTLQPGDWDVTGSLQFNPAGGAAPTFLQGSINTVSATIDSTTGNRVVQQISFGANLAQFMPVPSKRISLSVATAVYVVGYANFSSGSVSIDGLIKARRVR